MTQGHCLECPAGADLRTGFNLAILKKWCSSPGRCYQNGQDWMQRVSHEDSIAQLAQS